ncbi:hypothetical protein SAY87_028412 [Trapa incisa]|uniref:Uncharacterized protein n=1 Tax=Trapa incisa TaxID=236973 RepID=A0AAN7KZS0_9MYRT|nr:hypothetical protein SAY87_028412 [Trapa incisa]
MVCSAFLSLSFTSNRTQSLETMCSEICPPGITPFSSDREEKDPEQPMICELAGSDFEFSFVSGGLGKESCQSSADELFADGKILPFFHRASTNILDVDPRRAPLPRLLVHEKPSLAAEESPEAEKPAPRSLWGFRRSASLRSNIRKGRLPLLSRSNSTGSVPSQKRPLQKQPSVKMAKSPSLSSPSGSSLSSYGRHPQSQRPPLSRTTSLGSSSTNGVNRVSPVLKVPSPYIMGSANLFGLSSFFSIGKDKKKIRR